MTAGELLTPGEEGTPATTRPDSPTSSSVDLADADWNFAKREAALTRLGLDPALDSLPDEDLNKLKASYQNAACPVTRSCDSLVTAKEKIKQAQIHVIDLQVSININH